MPAPTLHFLEDARFSCSSCGKCCRSGFEIPIQPAKAESIRGTARYERLSKEGYQPLRVLTADFSFLSYDDDGGCHFLDDSLCGLHKDGGSNSKPVVCQLYPFGLTNTPDGVFVSTLFSCPSVLKLEGAELASHRGELEAMWEHEDGRIPQLPAVKEHILLTQYSTIHWSEYLEMESDLLKSLELKNPVISLLNFVARITDAPPSILVEELFPSFVNSLLIYLDEFESEDAYESFCQEMDNGGSPRSVRLGCDFKGFSTTQPVSEELRRIQLRYIRNQVHGKLLLSGPSLVCRSLLVCAALSVVANDVAHGQDLEASFDLCERLVSQSNELEEWLGDLEDQLL